MGLKFNGGEKRYRWCNHLVKSQNFADCGCERHLLGRALPFDLTRWTVDSTVMRRGGLGAEWAGASPFLSLSASSSPLTWTCVMVGLKWSGCNVRIRLWPRVVVVGGGGSAGALVN